MPPGMTTRSRSKARGSHHRGGGGGGGDRNFLYLLPTELRLEILLYALSPLPPRLRLRGEPTLETLHHAPRRFECPLLLVSRKLYKETLPLLYRHVAVRLSPFPESLRRLSALAAAARTHIRHVDLMLPLLPLSMPWPAAADAGLDEDDDDDDEDDEGPRVITGHQTPDKLLRALRRVVPHVHCLSLTLLSCHQNLRPIYTQPNNTLRPMCFLNQLAAHPDIGPRVTSLRYQWDATMSDVAAEDAGLLPLTDLRDVRNVLGPAVHPGSSLPNLRHVEVYFETPLSRVVGSSWAGFYRGSTREARRETLRVEFLREAEMMMPLWTVLPGLLGDKVDLHMFRTLVWQDGRGAEEIRFHKDWLKNVDREVQWLLERRMAELG